jgi:septal ring factor EnvC (AmiA/AmiB activator)
MQIDDELANLYCRLGKAEAELARAVAANDDTDTAAIEDEISDLRAEIEAIEDEDGADEQRSLEAWVGWSRV